MELSSNHFKSLDRNLIVEIMLRLDGCTLAALASTCICLSDAAREDGLWQKKCHNTWPSTSNRLLQIQIASSNRGGFRRFYADAFPLILHELSGEDLKGIPTVPATDTISSPWDFMSLVDIYFKGHAVYSKVVDGIMESMYCTGKDNFKRFLCYPFKVDLLGVDCPKGENTTMLPLDAFKDYIQGEDLCNQLLRDLRLSWILFDKRQGKAINISSWKPKSIYCSDPSTDGFVICFGCIIPIDDNVLTYPVAECVITAKCKLRMKQGCIQWKEITLVIKDIDGSHLNGEQSMAVMKQASICTRSINHHAVELGYRRFNKLKRKLKLKEQQWESSANILCAVAAIAALLGICYACATLL